MGIRLGEQVVGLLLGASDPMISQKLSFSGHYSDTTSFRHLMAFKALGYPT